MFDAIKKADAGYAVFAARMLAAEAAEAASIARLNASMTKYVAPMADSVAATVRPAGR